MRFKKFLRYCNYISKNTFNDIQKNYKKMLSKKELTEKFKKIKKMRF